MDHGVLIDNYLELIKFDKKYNIYISRKSLKHFVESRRKEMYYSHQESEIFDKLYFAVNNVIETFKNHNQFSKKEDGRFIYVKYFTELREHSLRIVLESVQNRLEICSIHFQKRKIPP